MSQTRFAPAEWGFVILDDWVKSWRKGSPTVRLMALFLVASFALGALFTYQAEIAERLPHRGLIITIGVASGLRIAWSIINCIRAFIFRFIKLPRLRREANALPFEQKYPDDVYFIIPTVREEPMVARRQLKAILREALKIRSHVTVIYATGDEAEHESIRKMLRNDPRAGAITALFTLQNSKRDGMARALRLAQKVHGCGESLVVLMDGDTVMSPDLLPNTLPLFSVRPRMGGLTTAIYAMATGGGPWFRDFYNSRFAARSHYMSALSFSNCVFTLTGRFSIVRGVAGLADGFINAIENDYMNDFVHGKVKLITGDDKSTWFYLKKQGWDMICVPDVVAYAMENAGLTPFRTTIFKLHRWIGNMLRFNLRALACGPRRMGGPWVYLSLMDQRISMWTSILGVVTTLVLCFTVSPFFIFFYLSIVILRRLLYLWMLKIEGNRITIRYLPIFVFCQWIDSVIKIWILSDISKQRWTADRVGKQARREQDVSWLSPAMTSRLYISSLVVVFLFAIIERTLLR